MAAEPDYAPAHLNLGVLYDLYLGEPQKALEQFEHYLALAGENKQVAGWVIELRKRVGSPAPAAAKKEPCMTRPNQVRCSWLAARLRHGAWPPAAANSPAGPPRSRLRTRTKRASRGPIHRRSPRPPADDSTAPGPGEDPACGRPQPRHARAAVPARQKAPMAADRVDLGTTTVTGDHEQPKVMYIVPWKKSDIGDLSGKPMNSLLDEALAPVDRDEFKREVLYYDAVKADVSGNGASRSSPPKQGEK